MKKAILVVAISGLVAATIISGCNSPAQKVEHAEEKVDQANKNLDKANEDYLADMDAYRKQNATEMAANDKSLADFKARIKDQKADARADYEAKLAELDKKNSDMKKKMDDYKSDGKTNWDAFKVGYNRDMENLKQAFWDMKNK